MTMAVWKACCTNCNKNNACGLGFVVASALMFLLVTMSARRRLQNGYNDEIMMHQKQDIEKQQPRQLSFGHLNRLGSHKTQVAIETGDALGSKPGMEEVLSPEARFIRDAVSEAHFTPLPTTAIEPGCVGNRLDTEVEDILCIPRPKYLTGIKNPCWWEEQPANTAPTLRCLPYFFILGCGKCGSSDLWNRITSHPHAFRIAGTMHKEAKWWAWGRYGHTNFRQVPIRSFIEYTNNFTELATRVKESLLAGDSNHKHFITGDASPSVLWDFRGWVNISQNRGLNVPQVLTPNLIRHFYPDPKFIVILRNPVDRLYSDYYFLNNGTSAESFHGAVLRAIHIFSECIQKRSVRECFFDNDIYYTLPLRLHYLFYSLYVAEWLKVFPKHVFLFVKNEDYSKDIKGTLQICMDFLGLESLSDQEMEKIAKQDHSLVGLRKQRAGPMLAVTRKLLEEMTRPSRQLLARLLNDEKFSWQDKV